MLLKSGFDVDCESNLHEYFADEITNVEAMLKNLDLLTVSRDFVRGAPAEPSVRMLQS